MTARDYAVAGLAVVAVSMTAALYLEHVSGLAPCPLCLMQRIWVMVAGIVLLVAIAHDPGRLAYPIAAGAAAVVGGGFSIRQLYLQSLPPDQVPACGPDISYMIEVFPPMQVLAAMVTGTGDCAEVTWSWLGLSLPGWALIGFGAVVALAVLQWRAQRA